MKEKLSVNHSFWDFYSKFKFQEKKGSNISSDFQIIYSQLGINRLTHLSELFINCGDQIHNLLSLSELFDSLSKSSKTISKTQEDLYKDEIKKLVEQIWDKLFENLLIIIGNGLVQPFVQLNSIGFLFLRQTSDTIKEQFSQLSNIHNEFSENTLQDTCIKYQVAIESMKFQQEKEFLVQQGLNKEEQFQVSQTIEAFLLQFIEKNQKLRQNFILFTNQRKIDVKNNFYITENLFLEIMIEQDLEKTIMIYFEKINKCISAQDLLDQDEIINTSKLENNLTKIKPVQKFFKIVKGLLQVHILTHQRISSNLQQKINTENDQKEKFNENEKYNIQTIIDDLLQSINDLLKQQSLNSSFTLQFIGEVSYNLTYKLNALEEYKNSENISVQQLQEIRLEGNEQLRLNLQNQLNLTYEELHVLTWIYGNLFGDGKFQLHQIVRC